MDQVVIVAATRTAVGKAPKGALKDMRPEDVGATVVLELLRRAGNLDPNMIDDIVVGCSFPEASQGGNLGRVIAMNAKLPDRVPGVTVNRFCASGLEAIAIGAQRIMSGMADVIVACGVESMSQIPLGGNMWYPNPALVDVRPGAYASMGLTAENVAQRLGVTRQQQDEFAVRSHQRAAAAIKAGKFKEQIVPLTLKRQKQLPNGKFAFEESIFDTDEGVRADSTIEGLSALKPVFATGGSVTAANSSQTSDGAAGVVLMTRKKAESLGLKPLASYKGYVAEGCDPELMGIGPVHAIPKVLQKTGLRREDIGLFELNEAFAAQAVYCVKTLELDDSIVNVNGGAVALGHPLGCTGAKLTTQLVYEMRARKVKYGIVSMCIGFGMGAAGVFELENN